MTFRWLAAAFFLFGGILEALTSSVIIPCHHAHFPLLAEVLQSYSYQSRAPDEIVVSLSGCDQLESAEIDALESTGYPFQLKILRHPEKVSRGRNRNLAAEHAFGEVLICQDADDLAHPERVAIVMRVLESNPGCNMVIHGCAMPHEAKTKARYVWRVAQRTFLGTPFDREDLPLFNYPAQRLPYQHHCFCNGVPVIKRSLWAEGLHWIEDLQRTEDVKFIRAALAQGASCIFVNLPLYFYRVPLSAGYEGSSPWIPALKEE